MTKMLKARVANCCSEREQLRNINFSFKEIHLEKFTNKLDAVEIVDSQEI